MAMLHSCCLFIFSIFNLPLENQTLDDNCPVEGAKISIRTVELLEKFI